ncbi:hypothetical protein MHK_006809 [Candidatus Magnetomorum sp. HK-1]|nr:hypothetical protein MHK_006809 [Candidatus Magnetomorum sp. HK-1]
MNDTTPFSYSTSQIHNSTLDSKLSDITHKKYEYPTYIHSSESTKKDDKMESNQEKLFDARFEHITYILNDFKETAKEIKEETKLIRKELKEENLLLNS